jgi:FkbM family methyltransferase
VTARRHAAAALEVATNRRGQRRPIARDYLFRLAGRLTESFTIETEHARFVLDTRDREISRILFIYGYYDVPLFESVFRALGRQPLRGRVFLDVGANIGSATVEALTRYGAERAVAFEPEPRNFRFLRLNLAANDLLDRVDAHRLALSDRDGEVDFELSESNFGDHRVRLNAPSENAFGESGRALVPVPARRLDDLIADGSVDLERVGLAWIDVQAHEPNVLAGAAELMASNVPVVVEYWPYGLRAAGALERMNELLASGWSHFVDTKDGNRPEPMSALATLARRYPQPHIGTDLVLLRR